MNLNQKRGKTTPNRQTSGAQSDAKLSEAAWNLSVRGSGHKADINTIQAEADRFYDRFVVIVLQQRTSN